MTTTNHSQDQLWGTSPAIAVDVLDSSLEKMLNQNHFFLILFTRGILLTQRSTIRAANGAVSAASRSQLWTLFTFPGIRHSQGHTLYSASILIGDDG
jgi:hypothetical protein